MTTLLEKVVWSVVRMGFRAIFFVADWIFNFAYRGEAQEVPPVWNSILLKSATRLAAEIREGKLRSQDVVLAYMERILKVEPYINATVDRRFEEAMKEAAHVDTLVASGAMSRERMAREKPLLGVPLSVKVLLTVKGMRSTASSMLFLDTRAAEDAPSVAALKEAGAIVMATTNTPEMGLGFETNNYAHGKTCNPYDITRTSGGSSGGESALIAAAGSVIGLGNDMLGSVRVPSFFTGIFSHKPTRGYVSLKGCFPVPDAELERYIYTGPMCRYAEDLNLTMGVLTAHNGTPLKFGQKVNFKNLKLYYMMKSKGPLMVDVDPEITAAMKKAISHFETTYGVRATEIQLPSLGIVTWMCLYNFVYSVKDMKKLLTAGKTDINVFVEFLKRLFGASKLSLMAILAMLARKTPFIFNSENEKSFAKLENMFRGKLNSVLADDNSVLLMPTFPMTAPYHYQVTLLLPSTGYTGLFNMLPNPATQCAMGLSKEGLPIGFQIVGRSGADPLTIACAVELEKAFGGWVPPAQ
ncbi:fatty-acid amide hydrolase 2-A-like [Uloborus diversus]|uniref:fatty-acid amide hydrolase 2-A-like n=1 Tax=Uloborus diversus TaxID=327109 RepID=UPI00240973CB|nr:fatty-acid amide hydrolase 2-A-like [Uloborus diversus]